MSMTADTPERPPVGPGPFLRDQVLGRPGSRITQEMLADALGVSRLTVNHLVNGRRVITAEMALRLAHVLGTSPDLWLDMQRDVDLFKARQKLREKAPPLLRLREPVVDPPHG